MFNFKKKNKLVTHGNAFHVDDVFVTAALFILLGEKNCEVIRTIDDEIIGYGDYIYDTGGIYDPKNNRFDHHQEGFDGKRENGVSYSSFGLVWKEYGEQICGSKEIADELDKKIVQPIDAMDNGINIYQHTYKDLHPYMFYDLVKVFNPTWLDKKGGSQSLFFDCVGIAQKILQREIEVMEYIDRAKGTLREMYDKTEDKRIIILDDQYPWKDILNKYPEPLFVIRQRKDRWTVKTVRDNLYSFENRKDLPESWAGKKDKELVDVTGVEDAMFCHKTRFVCGAKSKEGAIKLAQLALEE